jgi:predicted nucleic acid-binding protein
LADPPRKVYWDACAWIGFINGEPDKIRPLRGIWDDASRGKYEIWTSVYSYLEVIKIKAPDADPISVEESCRRIDEMLQQPFVKRVQLDMEVARFARSLKLAHHDAGLTSRPDAIHVATAAYYNLDELHTWDKAHILPFDGKIFRRDGTPLRILIPGPEVDGPLFAALIAPAAVIEKGAEALLLTSAAEEEQQSAQRPATALSGPPASDQIDGEEEGTPETTA